MCPIPVKNVREKLIETTPLSSLLSDCKMDVETIFKDKLKGKYKFMFYFPFVRLFGVR